MPNSSSRRLSPRRTLSLAACSAALLSTAAFCQSPDLLASAATAAPLSSSSLPDAPGVVSTGSSQPADDAFFGQQGALSTSPSAGPYAMVIQPGQSAPHISKGTEVVAGIRDTFSPLSLIGWAVSAGYSYATNGSPNYPQTGKGFAQQLGASAARASSESLFTESILGPVLHEDSRYYRMGKGHNVMVRLAYAGTRGLLTRTDGGHQTINFSNLGGNLAGSYLTKAYYPPLNTSTTEVFKTFGGSVGGSALGFVVSEFLPDIFHHHQ